MPSNRLTIAARASITLCVAIAATHSFASDLVNQSARFQINISIDRKSLATDFYRSTGRFYVDAKIRNTSSTDQTITVWSQFGWSWVCDQPDIGPGTEAAQNVPHRVTLKPRQEYQSPIEMFSERHSKKPVTFRLGFVPNVSTPASLNRQDYKNVTWSNFVTLP